MPLIINGELVDDSAIRDEARRLRPHFEDALAGLDAVTAEMQLRDWARESVIDRVLMRQEALRDPEPLPADRIAQELERMKTEAGGKVDCLTAPGAEEITREVEVRLRLDRLMAKLEKKTGHPKNSEITEYYKRNRERFWSDELVHAKHIVKNVDEHQDEATARAGIEDALQALNSGLSFEEVADRYSDCAGNGGDLGYFARGQMVEEFENVVFALEPGQTSGIFRSVFGFHIARVYDRRPAGIRPLAEVRGIIEDLLAQQKRERALSSFLNTVRARAVIEQGVKTRA
jgi:hypothetical protein